MNILEFRGGVHKPISHTTEKMAAFLITPKGDELAFHNAMNLGLIKPTPKERTYQTHHNYMKVFVQKVAHAKPKMFWSWLLELGSTFNPVTILGFSLTRGPLIFTARARILERDEILSSPLFKEATKEWIKDELYKPALSTLERMITVTVPDPKEGIRRINIRRNTDVPLVKSANGDQRLRPIFRNMRQARAED